MVVAFAGGVPAAEKAVVTVTVTAPGASAIALDTGVALPLAEAMSGIPGLAIVEAESSERTCTLIARFAPGISAAVAASLTADAVRATAPKLMRDADPPQIRMGDPRELPKYWLSLQGDTLALGDLSELARRAVAEPLAITPGVGQIQLLGAAEPQPTLWLDSAKMAATAVTPRDVAQAIEKQQADTVSAEIGQIVVATRNGAVLRVSDVGRFELAASRHGHASVDGQPAVLLAVTPTPAGLRPEELRRAVGAVAERLPAGVKLNVAAELSKGPQAPRWFLVELALPAGASPQAAARAMEHGVAILRKLPALPQVLAFSGENNDLTARLLLQEPAAAGATGGAVEIRRALAAELPEASPRVAELLFGDGDRAGPVAFPIRIALIGPDPAATAEWAKATATRLATADFVNDPAIEPAGAAIGEPRVSIEIDRDRAAALGIDEHDLADAVAEARGQPIQAHVAGKVLALHRSDDRGPEALQAIRLRTKSGEWASLATVATARQSLEPRVLYRLGRARGLLLTAAVPAPATTASKATAQCLDATAAVRRELKLSDDYKAVALSGE
jgi:multidrug efflux pump subunit AcrB